MVTTYRYTARRKVDGSIITTDTITDIANQGIDSMLATVRSILPISHPEARDLRPGDIDIQMSEVVPGR